MYSVFAELLWTKWTESSLTDSVSYLRTLVADVSAGSSLSAEPSSCTEAFVVCARCGFQSIPCTDSCENSSLTDGFVEVGKFAMLVVGPVVSE